MGAGQMRRSTRRADAMSGPAKRTRAATAGAASGAANEPARVARPTKKRRQQRPTLAPPEPESSECPSSTVLEAPQDSAEQSAGNDTDGSGSEEDTSPDDGSGENPSSSSDDGDTDVSDVDMRPPVDDGSPPITLDMVVWGTGLGRLQVC